MQRGGDVIGAKVAGVAFLAGMWQYQHRIGFCWLHEVVEVWHSQIFLQHLVLVSILGGVFSR